MQRAGPASPGDARKHGSSEKAIVSWRISGAPSRISGASDGEPSQRLSRASVKGGAMATFEVTAHLTVRPGQLEGFKKQAAECIRITKEKDTQTLRYDWFLSDDGECEVREAYTSPEGLVEHNRNILEARTKLFRDYADNHFMQFYGEPVPELVELAKATHMERHIKWFSFVKGLDSSSS
jgi:quinol monooxygenase YgiN